MTLKLILMRHAKSAWDDPLLTDFQRPLNDRGRRSAARVANWLVAEGHVPDEMIVSGAQRTVETWEIIAERLGRRDLRAERALYHAGADTMLSVLRGAHGKSVLMIGHNPGIAEFAARLVKSPPAHPRFADYPTAATTVMTFPGPTWKDAGWGSADVVDFVIPRELPDEG